MTVPLWAPFAALTLVCAVCPPPVWMRRVDWVRVGAWAIALGFCVFFWYALIGWVV